MNSLIAIVLFAVAFFRSAYQKFLSTRNEKQLVRMIIKRLKRHGLNSSYNGQEKDFADQVGRILKDRESSIRFQQILLELSFGNPKKDYKDDIFFLQVTAEKL